MCVCASNVTCGSRQRLWTELEENKKLIRELQDEKMELVLEKERQIQVRSGFSWIA